MISNVLELHMWLVSLVYAIGIGFGFGLGWLLVNSLFGAVRNRHF